jgi:large subunit ribosomal protein L15
MPLGQRLPKRGGFQNPFKKVYATVNLTRLNRFPDGAKVAVEDLYAMGLARQGLPVKLLGAGKLRRRLEIAAHAASETARAAIEARGGQVTLVEAPPRAVRKTARR